MTTARLALANLSFPTSPDDAVARAVQVIADAGAAGADVVCFPECFVPGYRVRAPAPPPPDVAFLQRAWATVAAAAGRARVAVVLGTERVVDGGLRISALVVDADGAVLGCQDKVQLDPSEDATYAPGAGRAVFTTRAGLTFGVVVCHEGFRYPETVRAAARQGARVVFHPHVHEWDGVSFRPTLYGDPRNSFHEHAARCRAAENTIWYATVNHASEGSGTTSAIIRPDGTVHAWQRYGEQGLLVADVDLDAATGLLAARCRA